MKKNMGNADRLIRTVLALVVIALIAMKTLHGMLMVVLGIVAIIFLLTSAIGFCPLYVPLKISTRRKKDPA